jgi:5'-methylthioadenosine phosphorylase
MGRLAIVLGSGAYGARGETVAGAVAAQGGETVAGAAGGQGVVIRQRHHGDGYRLPHRIDHAANLRSLIEAGCDRAIGFSSVGSLKEALGVGSFVCPEDFIAPQANESIFEDARGHMVPGFDSDWRARVISAWPPEGPELRDGGVYWQTRGPRFETPAEVRLLAAHADVVGMTIASEAIAARELGIPYAAICVVDNLANGIGPSPLTVDEIEGVRDVNAVRLRDILAALLPALAEA